MSVRMFASRALSNEPNPILIDVRRWGHNHWPTVSARFNYAADHGAYVTSDWERVTDPDHIAHARKVLARLASLQEPS